MVFSPACCLSGRRSTRKAVLPPWLPEEVVPASELSAALKQIRELQRLLGKKTMENEILKEAVDAKMDSACALVAKGQGIAQVSRALGVSRA